MRPILLLFYAVLAAQCVAKARVAHVLVALCDNEHQGIVKVPVGIGNGQKPSTNLYWGACYGVKTHFDRAPEWMRLMATTPTTPHKLERIVWKHRDSAVFLVADAYDGRNIREATEDLLRFTSGQGVEHIDIGHITISAGGGADLIAYVGHDGLMDFHLEKAFVPVDGRTRDAIILACMSRNFFSPHLRRTGASPLLWTTGLMAPEAYTLKAGLAGWVARESGEAVRQRAAVAYDTYQKCGIKAARRLLVSGW